LAAAASGVYRAREMKLKRDVAVKWLPQAHRERRQAHPLTTNEPRGHSSEFATEH